jgi:hypothetical protein
VVKRAWLLLAACSTDPIVLAPIIDSPPDGSDASAFPDLETIDLSIALAGAPDNLVDRTFVSGQTLELDEVPYGENLVVHMIGRVAGAEVAVGRTCPFAIRPNETPPSPHLYFARTVRWADSKTPTSGARMGGSAVSHLDGSGLYIGGLDANGAPILTIDQFDALAGRFSILAEVTPRRGGATAALGDGRVVIVGGIDPASGAAATMLDVVAPSATPERRVETIDGGPLVKAVAPALATLSDGRVIAFGGRDSVAPSSQLVEISGVGAGITLRTLTRAALATPRSNHTATRLSDSLGAPILIAGGLDAAGLPIATAEVYKPLSDVTEPAPGAAMIVPRRDHRAVRLPDGSILVAGGFDAANAPVRQFEVFSLEKGFTPTTGELPPTAGVTDQSITRLPDGRILFAGGRDSTGAVVDAAFIVRLDPLGGGVDVAITDRLSTPRAGHQATLLCDGTVMLVGGLATDSPAERYNPPAAGRR